MGSETGNEHCVFHDAPWPHLSAWCQYALDKYESESSVDLTECTTAPTL